MEKKSQLSHVWDILKIYVSGQRHTYITGKSSPITLCCLNIPLSHVSRSSWKHIRTRGIWNNQDVISNTFRQASPVQTSPFLSVNCCLPVSLSLCLLACLDAVSLHALCSLFVCITAYLFTRSLCTSWPSTFYFLVSCQDTSTSYQFSLHQYHNHHTSITTTAVTCPERIIT